MSLTNLHGYTGKIGVLVVLCLSVLLTVIASDPEHTLEKIFDQHLYERLQTTQIGSLDELFTDFDVERFRMLPILPPDPDFCLNQSAGLIAFDLQGFPQSFLDGLVPENDDKIPIYPLTVYEDPSSRERIMLNGNNEEIVRVAAPPDYDPAEYVNLNYPQAIGNVQEYNELKALYDPARIVVHYRLIEEKDIVKYVAKISIEQEIQRKEKMDKGGGIGIMMAYNGPPVTGITFTAIERTNSYIMLTVAYPWESGNPTNSYTNRLEFFGCTNLIDFWWTSLAVTNVSSATNWIEWVDTDTNTTVKFYAAGNADLDSDSDQITDAREKYVYHTSASTNDTDGDGRSDYQECIVLRTDPRNNDIVKPTLKIDCPSNNYTWVWLP